MKELVNDRERGIRATTETRGRWTRLTIELRDLTPDARKTVGDTLQGFAYGLWARFDGEHHRSET